MHSFLAGLLKNCIGMYGDFMGIFAVKFEAFFYYCSETAGAIKTALVNDTDLLSSSFIASEHLFPFVAVITPCGGVGVGGCDVRPQQNRRCRLPCKMNGQHLKLSVEKQAEERIAHERPLHIL